MTNDQTKKYKLTDQTIEHDGRTLYRIQALIDIPHHYVSKGDVGGYIESENNLSHDDGAWVADNAKVYGNATLYDTAYVSENAYVYDNARICGNARVYANAMLSNHALVMDWAEVYGEARLFDHAIVIDHAKIYGNAHLSRYAYIYDNAEIFGDTELYTNEIIGETARIKKQNDYFSATNAGPVSTPLTIYKGATELIVMLHDVYTGSIDGFLAHSKARYDQKTHQEHTLLVEIAKSRILGD